MWRLRRTSALLSLLLAVGGVFMLYLVLDIATFGEEDIELQKVTGDSRSTSMYLLSLCLYVYFTSPTPISISLLAHNAESTAVSTDGLTTIIALNYITFRLSCSIAV